MNIFRKRDGKSYSFLFFISFAVFTAVLSFSLLFTACENIFSVGMGGGVDLEPPEVSLTSHQPRSYLGGTVTFSGKATDDLKVERVEISFNRGNSWQSVAAYNKNAETWSHEIDTEPLEDGDLFVTLRVTDGEGKITTSEDYLFYVDNSPPVVLITTPEIISSLGPQNTSLLLTVEADDTHRINQYRIYAQAATIDDPDIDINDLSGEEYANLDWQVLEGYPKEIAQDTSPLRHNFSSVPHTLDLESENQEGPHRRLFRFGAAARDQAGNWSSQFYHIEDVRKLVSGGLRADEIYEFIYSDDESRTFTDGEAVSKEELLATARTFEERPLEIEFDESTDKPIGRLIFPYSQSDTDEHPMMRSTELMQGAFIDDDGIAPETMHIKIERPDPAGSFEPETGEAGGWSAVTDSEWETIEQYSFGESGARRIDWEYNVENIGLGYFRLSLRAEDIDGTASRPFTRLFIISDGDPEIEIDPPENTFFSNTFKLTGTARHSITLSSVDVKIGYGSANDPEWIFDGYADSGDEELRNELRAEYDPETETWVFNTSEALKDKIDDELNDGPVLVQVRASVGSDSSSRNITLTKDTEPPEVAFDIPEAGSSLNTIAEIRGSSDDSLSGSRFVEILISPDQAGNSQDPENSDKWVGFDTNVDLKQAGYTFGNTITNWRFRFDTERYAAVHDGELEIKIFARAWDRADNSKVTSRTFMIDQESDLPVITFTNVDESGSQYSNVLGGDPRLIGSITDDDAVNPDTFVYRVDRLQQDSWSDWINVYEEGTRSPVSRIDFNIPLFDPENPGVPLPDGTHDIELWVEDIDGTGISRTEKDNGGALRLVISVDSGPPSISNVSPATGSIFNDKFTISGTAGDGFGIGSIDISFDGGSSYQTPAIYKFDSESGEEPEKNRDFTYAVEVDPEIDGSLADGTYNIRLRVKDLSDQVGTENLTVTIDTEPPTVAINNPADGTDVYHSVPIQGTSNDNRQMAAVYRQVIAGAEISPLPELPEEEELNGWDQFETNYSWSCLWDTKAYQQEEAENGQDPYQRQDYTIYIAAIDTAGNWSSIETVTVTVDQESDRPQIEISNLNKEGTGFFDESLDGEGDKELNIFNNNPVITGTVSDDDGLKEGYLEVRTRTFNWDPVNEADMWTAWSNWEVIGTGTTTRVNRNFSYDAAGLGEGVHQFQLRAKDVLFTETLSGTELDLEPDHDLGDHPDNFNWNLQGPVEFAVDLSPPVLVVTGPEGGENFNTAFLITGTASDSNGIAEVKYSTDGQAPWIPLDLEKIGTGALAKYGWEISISTAMEGEGDGHYTYHIRAVDRFNKTETKEFSFTIDTEPPEITITQPIESVQEDELVWLQGSSATIRGTVTDATSGVAEVRYQVVDTGSMPDEDFNEWALASGVDTWSGSINLFEIEEGRKTLFVAARDNTDNITPLPPSEGAASRNFGIDQEAPTVNETQLGSSMVGRNIEFSMDGEVGDSNELAALRVEQRKGPLGEAEYIEIFNDPNLSGKEANWEVTHLPRNPDSATPTDLESDVSDGVYHYIITVTDAAGKETTLSRQVRVDLVGPEVQIISPSPGASVQGTALFINGTATDYEDVSPIEQVRYWVGPAGNDNGGDAPANYSDWHRAEGGSNWSATLNFAELIGEGEEGSLKLQVIAQDTAGNWGEEIESVGFDLDQAPPEIQEFAITGPVNTVSGNNYAQDDFSLTFTAFDSNELKDIIINRRFGDTEEEIYSQNLSGTENTTINVTLAQPLTYWDGETHQVLLQDGTYQYEIIVTDVVNKTAAKSFSVVVDTTPPELEITNLIPVLQQEEDGDEKVNGTIRVNVAAGDAGGLLGVKWWIIEGETPATPPEYEDENGTLFTSTPYTAFIDTLDLVGEDDPPTPYTLYIAARDRALNDTRISRTVIVDQMSDFPTVTFTDLDPAIDAADDAAGNLLELNPRIRGVVEDDDKVDRNSLEILLNSHETAGGPWTPITSVGTGTRSVNFTHNLGPDGEGLEDDVHFFYLRFSDDPEAKIGDNPVTRTTTAGPVFFVIDTQNPELAFTAPGVNSYQTDNFTVSGTAYDASGITTVEISIDGTAYVPVNDTSNGNPAFSTWSQELDISGIADDGIVSIYVRGVDAFDKSTIIERQVTIDREPPEVSINNPVIGDPYEVVNSEVTIWGTTTDNFEIDKTYLWIGRADAEGNLVDAEGNLIDPPSIETDLSEWEEAGRYSWEYYWNTYDWQNINQGNFDTQNYTLHVVAQDSAGNWSAIDTVTVTVDQESNKPIIEMTSIDDTEAATADENLLPVNLQINGTVEDDDAVDPLSIQVRVEYLSDETEVFGWTNISGPPTSLKAFVSWSHTFSADTSTALTDGEYRLFVRAADINDHRTYDQFTSSEIGPINFAVDLANPTGSVTAPTQGAFINDDPFEIEGTAYDGNGLKSVEILFDGEENTVPAVDTSGGDPAYSTWEYTFDASETDDGQISYQVIITDNYDKVTILSRSFTLDQTPPTVAYIEPAAEAVVNGSLLVRGTSDDEFGVASVSYALQSLSEPADDEPDYPADYTPLTSTFSWDFRINTTDPEFGDGDYRIFIVAADQAGNTNAENPITRDVTFDQSTNLPVITISNASDNSEEPTLFGSGGVILGTITDDDGVDHTSIQIAFVENPQEEDWIAVSNPPLSGGVSVNFSHSLAGVAESADTYTVHVRAFDIGETLYGVDPVFNVSDPVYIGVDRYNPAVALETLDIVDPYNGEDRDDVPYTAGMLVNDDFTLRGTASDGSGIVEVRVQIDGGTIEEATYNVGEWSYLVPVTRVAASDGPMTIIVEAEDEWGKITTRTYNIVIDTTEPLITFTEPDFGSNVNGEVKLRGNNSDANSIISLLLELGLDVEDDPAKTPFELTNTGTLLSWEAEVDTNDYANPDRGEETVENSNVWLVPFVVTVEDAAGNIAIEERTLIVDPDSDKPIIAITSPEVGASVPTEFVFQGTITDDDPPPMSVQLAADSNNDGTFDVDLGEIAGITSGSWVKIIDTTDTDVFPTPPSGTISLRAIPFDQYGLEGKTVFRDVFVDTMAPIVSISSPETGDIVRGEITIAGTFRDDQALAESQMRVSFDGGNTFTAIGNVAGSSITPNPENSVGGEYRYDFSIPVNTETQVDGGNGFLEIAVRVTDATFKQNTAFLDLSADNTRPTMELNYDGTMEFFGSGDNIVYTFDGNADEGGNYIIIGSAEDKGEVSGIDRIDVYFVKSGEFLGVREGVIRLAETTDTIHDQDGDLQVIPYRVPEPREGDKVLVDDYVISIDNRFERGIYDQDDDFGDDDGFQESLRTIGAIDEWYVYIDTTILPDGPFTLYAVVYDLAGNASFIEAAAQAANYPPLISGVQVGTRDLGSDGSLAKDQGDVNIIVEATDTVDPFENQGILVNSFKLTVAGQYAIGDGGAIGAEQEGFTSFFYGSQVGALANFDTRDPATGSAVTATAEKSIDTTSLASGFWYRFVAEAVDQDGNLASRDFYLWINNEDDLPPVVTIDEFSQGSVSGLPGHVDLPDAANPALSGTVNITGTIYDDTSVDSLTFEILADDGATWEIFGAVTEFGDSILEDDDDFGVKYNWSYEWDTATIADITGIAGAAQEDLIIRAFGSDGTNITPIADQPQKNVDVVPYITNILTGFDAGLLAQARRSATGQYPVQVGQEITIVGYNMPGTAANSVSAGGTQLTPASADGTSSVTVDLGATNTSGELEVITNGVVSRNNTNDNSAPQNQESTLFNNNLTDDRYLVFWDITSHIDIANVSDATMRSSGSDSVAWTYLQGGNFLRYTNSVLNGNAYLTDGFSLRYTDFSVNSDGTPLWVYLHDATWTDRTTWKYFGGIQWGQGVPGPEGDKPDNDPEAYNWNLNETARIGLGNMSFEADGDFAATDFMLHRYRKPRIITTEDYLDPDTPENGLAGDLDTKNYVVFQDISSETRGLVFYGFSAGTAVTAADGSTFTDGWRADITKTPGRADQVYAVAGGYNQQETGVKTPADRRGVITTDNATFFDLGITEDGHAVAVWYDQGSGNLKYSYNDTPLTTPNNWSAAVTIAEDAGTHVALEVDPVNGVHIAYMDSSSSYLNYTYISAYNNPAETVTVLVDAMYSSGQQNGITIRDFGAGDYRPVISTFSTTYSGSRGAVRAAWPETPLISLANGADPATGKYTGYWEVMTVPAATPAQVVPTFVEVVDPSGNNRITTGYNGEYLEEATYLGWD